MQIGIVACSAEGAALCYRTICGEAREQVEVSLHSLPLAGYVESLNRGDLQGDNTIHQAMPYVVPKSPLPWLHIAEVVAQEAAARGFKRVGITGTRWLVESEVYPSKLSAVGIEAVRPSVADRGEIQRVIMEELVNGVFTSVALFQRVFEKLRTNGCDAVVLGCTEIPLLMNDANSPLPTLDSTRLLARAALRRAAGK